jgi:peptide/nickel transport system substrate-binding protein
MKKFVCLIGCILMILSAIGVQAQVKNPDTFVMADYRTVQTIDPATSYDVAGSMRIWNLYETLIFFDGSSTEKYVPLLAAEVPTVANGGISADGMTYTFVIRKGVRFHEGGNLTPEDVVYSFKRNMIVDQDGGPMWSGSRRRPHVDAAGGPHRLGRHTG